MDALPDLVLNTAADPARRKAWLGFRDSRARLDPPRLHVSWPGGQGELHVEAAGAGASRAELRVDCEAAEVAARMLDALADQVNENFNPD